MNRLYRWQPKKPRARQTQRAIIRRFAKPLKAGLGSTKDLYQNTSETSSQWLIQGSKMHPIVTDGNKVVT